MDAVDCICVVVGDGHYELGVPTRDIALAVSSFEDFAITRRAVLVPPGMRNGEGRVAARAGNGRRSAPGCWVLIC